MSGILRPVFDDRRAHSLISVSFKNNVLNQFEASELKELYAKLGMNAARPKCA